ncbi:MAG: hypothetical protein IT457_24475 [Planctomycetes bacterium]|nr:hypothetical protein [Planctomycetota bacterium]
MTSAAAERDSPHGTALLARGLADTLGAWLATCALPVPNGFAIVKSSTVRHVSAGELAPGLAVHFKVHRAATLADRARDLWRGARGRVELERLATAHARGLPCVEPLAAGRFEGPSGPRSFVLTRSVPGAVPLPRGPLDPASAAAAGALLRAAHDAGLRARDLHPGNVLRDRSGALLLCDLTSASFTESLELRARAQGLAFFCQDLDGSVLDPAAAPLLAAYAASPELVRLAMQCGRRLRMRALAAFGRRATRTCRHTRELREADDVRWYFATETAELHAAARDAALATPPANPVKSGRRGAVWFDGALVVKRRATAAARRLHQASYRLRFAGVAAPAPVALRIHHGVGLVFTARVARPDLHAELQAGALDTAAQLDAARALGRSVGRLHAHGLRNRDLKFENLVRDPARGEVLMVDLDGVRAKSPADGRGQAADLGRLLAALVDHRLPAQARVVVSFWRSYLAARRCLRSTQATDLRRRTAARARAWARTHTATTVR